MKQAILVFVNEKLTKAPDDGRSTKQLYLNYMRYFWYHPKDRTRRWVEKVVARKKRLITRVWKQFEKTVKRGSKVPGRKAEVLIGTDPPTRKSNRLQIPRSVRSSERRTRLRLPLLHTVCHKKKGPYRKEVRYLLGRIALCVYVLGRLLQRQRSY